MGIQTGTDPESGQPTVTFTISEVTAAAVSVVGSFNAWTPGLHPLEPMGDGTLAVTVLVRPAEEVHFRYLDSDGRWFDDAESDEINEYGSVIAASRLTARPSETAAVDPRAEPEVPVRARRVARQRA